MSIKDKFSITRLLPEPVTPDNYPELCETFYATHMPPKAAMRAAHVVMASLYRPGISFDPEAAAMIRGNFAEQRPMIIAANHDLFEDQYVVGSAMQTVEPLKGFVGTTLILGKLPYSATPLGRFRNDNQGLIPVCRAQDIFAYVLAQHESMTEQQIFGLSKAESEQYAEKYAAEISAYSVQAAKGILRVTTTQLESGTNLFIYPEGTRNKDRKTWRNVQNLEGGIGTIACAAARKDIDVEVVPIMTAYSGTRARQGSHVHVGQPISPGINKSKFMGVLETAMQRGLDTAYHRLDKTA